MSTDLQFRQQQDFLQIRLPAVKTTILPKQSSTIDNDDAAIDHVDLLQTPTTSTTQDDSSAAATADDEYEECSTPTSAEHKIPAVFSCPPAPKKQRYEPAANSCKRKLGQFHEIVARDEIEEYFRSSFETVNRNSKRRRHL